MVLASKEILQLARHVPSALQMKTPMESCVRPLVASHLAHEILAYLAEHPLAQDTLEGILEWWLLDRQIVHQTSAVKSALEELVANGLVLETHANDSRAHYRVNPNKFGDLLQTLEEASTLLRIANQRPLLPE